MSALSEGCCDSTCGHHEDARSAREAQDYTDGGIRVFEPVFRYTAPKAERCYVATPPTDKP